MNYIQWIYISYFFILGILIIVQTTDLKATYTNYGTAVVTVLHLILGSIELSGLRIELSGLRIQINDTKTIIDSLRGRYTNRIYNILADILITATLILSIYTLVKNKRNQPLWLAFTPISVAFIANIGCLKGRLDDKKKTNYQIQIEEVNAFI